MPWPESWPSIGRTVTIWEQLGTIQPTPVLGPPVLKQSGKAGRSGEVERARANQRSIEAEMSSSEPEVERDGDGFERDVFLG